MKSTLFGLLLVAGLAAPTLSFAQQAANTPLTRAEVKAQLVQLENVGFDPAVRDDNYPDNIQAAEALVQEQQLASQHTAADVGSSTAGSSQAGTALGN